MTEPTIDFSAFNGREAANVQPQRTEDPRWDGSATPKQLSFLRSLAEQKGKVDEVAAELAKGHGPSKARASALIERLLQLSSQGATAPATTSGLDLRELNGGYYAATLNGVTKFFRIDRVLDADNRWFGWSFVKIQAGDELHKQGSQRPNSNVYVGASQDYLAEIVKDEEAAYRLYGTELGRCGVCGRTLTNEESRAYGIGPDCREKMGI